MKERMVFTGDRNNSKTPYKKMTLMEFKKNFPDWRYSISFIGEPPLYTYEGHRESQRYYIYFDEEQVKESLHQDEKRNIIKNKLRG